MVEPVAHIRVYEASDNKLVRFVIGKSHLESLAIANRRAYFHPLTISLWIAASCILIQFMQWWPRSEHGYWGYLSPLPALGSMAVPIMFLVDWLNRPFFEKLASDALKRPDIPDIRSYYNRSPASGFWILEYGERFVGLIALDASIDSEFNSPVSKEIMDKTKKKGTSRIATIRHFYVEEPYRVIGIQKDLLDHAVHHAFTSGSIVQVIKAADSPLVSYIRECLRSAGFQLQKHTDKVGVLGWKLGERILEKADWEKTAKD